MSEAGRHKIAGVRERDPQRPELAHEVVDRRGERVGVGHIGRSRRARRPVAAYFLDQGVETVAVEADHGDVGAFARGAQGGCPSDAAAPRR